jgi:hypothetical protein
VSDIPFWRVSEKAMQESFLNLLRAASRKSNQHSKILLSVSSNIVIPSLHQRQSEKSKRNLGQQVYEDNDTAMKVMSAMRRISKGFSDIPSKHGSAYLRK